MSLTSIYCGAGNIHHTAVKVTAPDGSFAETPASRDSYETTDLGEHIEKADYKMGQDGGLIGFVAANKDRNLRVVYQGERSYTTQMTPADRQAAASVYELSKVLSAITEIKTNLEEAHLKIQFVQKRCPNGRRRPNKPRLHETCMHTRLRKTSRLPWEKHPFIQLKRMLCPA